MKRSRKKHAGTRVFIVDDHPMMRMGLAQFLSQESGLSICGEASCAAEALEGIEHTQPDLVLLDISLQGRSGLDLLQDLRSRFPLIRVLVHTMHDEMIYADRALAAGAHGYLMKQETGDKLICAIRQVMEGGVFLSNGMKSKVRNKSRKAESADTPISSLTKREFEVFQLIGSGCTNQEIAAQLHISQKTVEVHRENMKRKLGVSSSTALNLLAVRWESNQAG